MTSDRQPEGRMSRLRAFAASSLPIVVALAVVLVAGVLLFRIIFSSVEIGAPASESDALIRSNERLLQMVQWTVSTILLIGGGLIGLNWYSNEKRFTAEVDSMRKEIAAADTRHNKLLLTLQAESITHREMILAANMELYKLRSQIAGTMMLQGLDSAASGIVDAAINAIRRQDAQEFMRDHILDTVLFQFRNSDPNSSFTEFLGVEKLPELAEVAAELGHEEKAQQIRQLYDEMNKRRKGH